MALCCRASAILVDYRAKKRAKDSYPSFWMSVIFKGLKFWQNVQVNFFGLAVNFGLRPDKISVNIIFILAGLRRTENFNPVF